MLLLSTACPSPPSPSEGGTTDAGTDASLPDTSSPDAAAETGAEASAEAGDAAPDARPDATPEAGMDASAEAGDAGGATWCSLGADVPGLTVPAGFCLREFAYQAPTSGPGLNPRSIVFAPNGDLFVASPSTGAPGGACCGHGAVLVLSDDNRDGRADAINEFAQGIALTSVQGLDLGGGYLYFTTEHAVWRTPVAAGQRVEDSAMRVNLNVDSVTFSSGRWTHGLARSQGGRLYTSRGEHTAACASFPIGAVFNIGTTGALTNVADGFRNPMYLGCHWRDEVCLISELGEDGSGPNGREKLTILDLAPRHYGYPHCYRPNVPVGGCGTATECMSPGIGTESFAFDIGTTPFGFDWEREQWPAPYRGALFVALHGVVGSYFGAGVVYVPTDPTTHLPTGAPHQMFVQGFGDISVRNERPSDIAFSPDGRLFFSIDQGHKIYWIAPTTLRIPTP